MKKFLAATAITLCGALAVPATAGAFNPQPDPPGKAAIATLVRVVTNLDNTLLAVPHTLCHAKPSNVPPDPICGGASNPTG